MQRRCLSAPQICLRNPCYLFGCFMMLAADITLFKVTRTTQSICLIPIMETNKCSVSKTLRNVHHCTSRPTRRGKNPWLVRCFCQGGSCWESATLHPPGIAHHDGMHSILVSCTLLKTFRRGLMVLLWLSRAVWTVRTETCSLKKTKLAVILMTSEVVSALGCHFMPIHLSLTTLWKYFQMAHDH